MVQAQPLGVDGMKCPFAVPVGIVLLHIGKQFLIFMDLIEDVIDSSIVYLILWHMLRYLVLLHRQV